MAWATGSRTARSTAWLAPAMPASTATATPVSTVFRSTA